MHAWCHDRQTASASKCVCLSLLVHTTPHHTGQTEGKECIRAVLTTSIHHDTPDRMYGVYHDYIIFLSAYAGLDCSTDVVKKLGPLQMGGWADGAGGTLGQAGRQAGRQGERSAWQAAQDSAPRTHYYTW